jgi:hypothetical protein
VLDLDGGGFTIAAWVRPRPGGVVASRRRSWSVIADASGVRGQVQWACGTPIPCRLDVTAPPLPDRWTHLAVVYRTSSPSWSVRSLELFVDGQLVATQSTTEGWSPLPNRGEVVHIGSGLGGETYRGLIDETSVYGVALSADVIAWLASFPEERLRIVFQAGEFRFQPDAKPELTRIKEAGFNTIWMYFHGSPQGNEDTRRAFADACFSEGVGVIASSEFVNELATHPALIGFWTYDEPTAHQVPIASQRSAYQKVKAVTDKPVFVVHTDLKDESLREFYAPDVQDVVALDLYPYMLAPNPGRTLERAKWLLFTGTAQLFLNRISDFDKAKLSRYIPVFGSFVERGPNPQWAKGDTYGAHSFWDRLAGHPSSHGVFLWSFPTLPLPSNYLIGLGQQENRFGRRLMAEYQRFLTDTPSFDDLSFEYFAGRDLAEFAVPGTYEISLYNLNNGSGRFAVSANAQGSTTVFTIPLRKGSGSSFHNLYAALQTVMPETKDDLPQPQITLSYQLPGQDPVTFASWVAARGHQYVPIAKDLREQTTGATTDVTVLVEVRWNGLISPYAAILSAGFALE